MTDDERSTAENTGSASLSPDDLHERIRRGEAVHLLDVRNRDEVEAWRITGESVDATQVTYAEFAAAKARGEVGELVADLDLRGPVVTVCPRGEVSATVAELLREEGIDARNLDSGMAGWARVYVAREVPVSAGLGADPTVRQYDRPASGCLAYLVVSGDEATVIDPLRAFADRYVADAEQLGAELTYAIDTHVHADHVSGVRRLADDAGAQAVLPAGATERGLADDGLDPRLLDDGGEIRVGEATLTALHAPGHTTELSALRLGGASASLGDASASLESESARDEGVLFSGDALFADGFGRPDLERGDEGARDLAGTLYDTLTERLLALPDETLVAPGHRTPDSAPNPGENDTFTARLDAVRDRLRIPDERGAFVERVLDSLPPRPANYEEIIAANLGRESLDDESAFEVELGPNNCAVAEMD
ncbi:MBL fold metallo-hydrolase [Halorussus gelatinilyticus]|uniref:MBL fold metallo-hydrolase n=1 Tax=Halorussus gelatinilyticus TaxID=2937524 RepID=A0A8U0IDU4_9EURY|nr:MBL fold metallo-hydrolase [Halorussus gelatinilyticus]UPV99226.1 MBL fold metallo-hydrolase [Halorussus gelatinilyticus]